MLTNKKICEKYGFNSNEDYDDNTIKTNEKIFNNGYGYNEINLNNPIEILWLGNYFKKEKNYDEMIKYYLMAIDKGNTDAMFDLIKNIQIYKNDCNDIDKITLYNNLLKINNKNNLLKKIIIELKNIIKKIDLNKAIEQLTIYQSNIKISKDVDINNICECLICFEKKEYVSFDKCNHKVCEDCFIQIDKCPYRCL